MLLAATADAGQLDELPLDRWAKLREAERYQMNIAEKYYREQQWKPALTEYEKFLSLHEESDGAAYAQLKWSLCQLNLRKPNAAIKDGFQSVIDYWPDSNEATIASYMIGFAYKSMGEVKAAKKAYTGVLATSPKHLVAVLARVDLLEIARSENDTPRRVQLWRDLVFNSDRTGEAANPCANASRELATHCFLTGAVDEAIKALATTYPPEQLHVQVAAHARAPLQQLASQNDTKAAAGKYADLAINWFKQQTPADLSDPANKLLARQMWYHVAEMYDAAMRFDEVPDVFEETLKKFGQDDETLGRLGKWYRTQGKFDQARATYGRFMNQVQALAEMAMSFREEKKFDQAVEIYNRLQASDPDHAIDWMAQMAETYRTAQKCDEAVGVYSNLVQADTKAPNRWQYEIGNTYRHFGRHKEAIAAYRLCDNFPDCYIQMAYSHRDLGEFKEALALYSEIIVSHENWASWATLQMGYTYEQAGDKEKAIKALQRVCKKYYKSPQASEAHVYLNDKFKIRVTLGGAAEE